MEILMLIGLIFMLGMVLAVPVFFVMVLAAIPGAIQKNKDKALMREFLRNGGRK